MSLHMDGMRGHVFYGVTALRRTGLLAALDQLGVPKPDLELLTGKAIWLSPDRYRVRRVLEACMFSSLDLLGLQRFEFSAHWIATWIALMVAPANHLTACAWYSGAQSADAVQMDPESVPLAEGMDARQIFELVRQAVVCMEMEHTGFAEELEHAVYQGRRAVEEMQSEQVAAS